MHCWAFIEATFLVCELKRESSIDYNVCVAGLLGAISKVFHYFNFDLT
jgi:hypothetical protein